jgi:hypothetical protein
MQISTDTDILETIFAHSVTAAHLASKLDNTIVVEELTKSVSEIGNIIENLLGWNALHPVECREVRLEFCPRVRRESAVGPGSPFVDLDVIVQHREQEYERWICG